MNTDQPPLGPGTHPTLGYYMAFKIVGLAICVEYVDGRTGVLTFLEHEQYRTKENEDDNGS